MENNSIQSNSTKPPKSRAIWMLLAVALVMLGAGAYYFSAKKERPSLGQEITLSEGSVVETKIIFGNPKKSAHYESNTPSHAAILAGVPVNVVIDFNFDLAKPSAISVKSGSKEYGLGETAIDTNKLAMRREMDPQAPDGLYDVAYTACWPDGSCHEGNFQFAIDRSLAKDFTDRRGSTEVEIDMKDLSFTPRNILVSRGTKTTWINRDAAEHFVNTETHPAHTYFPAQNSRGLQMGDAFSVTFERAGIYPYHCSAHAAIMAGQILVE